MGDRIDLWPARGTTPRDDDEVGRYVVTVAVPADVDLPNASAIEAAVQAILPRGFVVGVEVTA